MSNEQLTVNQVQEAKFRLAKQIHEALVEFQEETGLCPHVEIGKRDNRVTVTKIEVKL